MPKPIRFPVFVSFTLSPLGRISRAIVGLAMIIGGFTSFTVLGLLVTALGFIPLGAGALDLCVSGPLLGGFFSGAKMRRALHDQMGKPSLGSRSRSWAMA